MMTVEIYTTRTCPFCIRAKQLLDQKGVNYNEIDVGADPSLRSSMTQRANGKRTVPQIFVGNTHVGGCDDLYAMDRAGKLDPLLKGAA
ncbi:MAG: glutaredoxin 3 [Paracoccus sp. (in: a-proteobacteria)]|uniref:glutaredoxin 3 n=1 Tax=Paracoccus sp. TaxID=267 RepID=UPI002E891540|nr:glutaredoxin 3 [Pseudomonadota bacterium]